MKKVKLFTAFCLLVLLSLSTQAQSWNQIVKTVASDRATGDQFGRSVAISGDYAIVGAPQEDQDAAGGNTLSQAGSVYILKNVAGTWTQVKKITASTRASEDYFGVSVAISGDYAIVGSLDSEDAAESNYINSSGSAYIFKKNQGGENNWGQVKKITASVRAASDWFGISVAISGDYAIVGADRNSLTNSGSAYIFKKNQGGSDGWGQVKKITAPTGAAYDDFGWSVAISGEYAIVGDMYEDEYVGAGNLLVNSGSAYIFKQSQGGADNWGQVKRITASTRAAGDLFGKSVAISGDYIIVGAYAEDEDTVEGNTITDAGSAYIFKKDQGGAGNWGQVKKITASTRAVGDGFGYSVAISGDYAIVGVPTEDEDGAEANTVNNAGSAYIFKRTQGEADNWGQVKKITAPTRAADDWFGNSVAISGNYAIVGAYTEDEDAAEVNTLNDAGSAYIFKNTTPVSTLALESQLSVNVYPNPSSGLVNVSGVEKGIYAVFNTLGQQVLAGELNSEISTLDLSKQANGMYLLKVVSGNEMLTKQLIINR